MKQRKIQLIISIILVSALFSCKKFLEIGPPKNSLSPSTVFKNDNLATSALLGIYQQMALSGPESGDYNSVSTICGLTGDEFIGYNQTLQPFYENNILARDILTLQIWSGLYQRIYDANAILEGLESENGVTPPIKAQIKGEAYFVRAFNYFYLVNLFGSLPLQLTTDYKANSQVKRSSIDEIYAQIISDLKAAELLLQDNYVTDERVRPNKATVQALLARTYLYLEDWTDAEKYSTSIIEKSNTFSLVELNNVFLKNSKETIWQLMPPANTNTPAGNFLILITSPVFVALRPDFVKNSFESNDLRQSEWIKSITSDGVKYYYPFKYKVQNSTIVSEYEMVFRLAEQYLIRAEARAKLDNLTGAIADLDLLRKRAGIPLIIDKNPGINKIDLVEAIQKERKVELFSEWGDRWFNLKRTGKSNIELSLIKSNWKSTNILFPIPGSEIDNNNNIVQNPGY